MSPCVCVCAQASTGGCYDWRICLFLPAGGMGQCLWVWCACACNQYEHGGGVQECDALAGRQPFKPLSIVRIDESQLEAEAMDEGYMCVSAGQVCIV